MNLFLLRHGDSEPQADSDDQRQLTNKGRQQALDIAFKFISRGAKINRCFVSPYVRAIQTADSFLSRIPNSPSMEIEPLLCPEIRAAKVITFLETVNESNVLLVTHNPLVSELNAVLQDGHIERIVLLETCDLSAMSLDIIAPAMAVPSFYISPEVPN